MKRHSTNFLDIIKKPKTIIRSPELYYKTNHTFIGTALIFYHCQFRTCLKRTCTENDCENLKKALDLYGFDVRIYEDQTEFGINNILNKVSKENHNDCDCLFVVVMTHGTNGYLNAYDKLYPVANLWTPFFGHNCKSLINKPKLFFIQACRIHHDKIELEYNVEYTVGVNDLLTNCNYQSHRQSPTESIENQKTTYSIPSSADILVMYSCCEGKASLRTWFIPTLILILEKYAEKTEFDLYHFLTEINHKIAYDYDLECKSEKLQHVCGSKQMPNFTSTLTKILLLKPKPLQKC